MRHLKILPDFIELNKALSSNQNWKFVCSLTSDTEHLPSQQMHRIHSTPTVYGPTVDTHKGHKVSSDALKIIMN